jgi:Leucine-rich repeat (LRR) protein
MSFNSIEEYFAQFPDDIESIGVLIQTHYLPDLSRFYKLRELQCTDNQLTQLPTLPPTLKYLTCCHNELTQLPTLPPTLIMLYCSNNELTQLPTLPPTLTMLLCCYNQLTQLPTLPPTLTYLYCSNNQLTQLPNLPSTLTKLLCCNNQLTQLPILPPTLIHLDCQNNLLPFDHHIYETNITKYIIEMRNKNNISIRFKELFYALKYKKRFRDLLWVRIREPKIRNKYHPDNLIKLLEDREKLTLDELDELDYNW